jgi:hypothetical protein
VAGLQDLLPESLQRIEAGVLPQVGKEGLEILSMHLVAGRGEYRYLRMGLPFRVGPV